MAEFSENSNVTILQVSFCFLTVPLHFQRYSLIEGYEALVGCRFVGTYCGIRASAAVFKVLKNQPTTEAGNLRMRMDFLRQITQQVR